MCHKCGHKKCKHQCDHKRDCIRRLKVTKSAKIKNLTLCRVKPKILCVPSCKFPTIQCAIDSLAGGKHTNVIIKVAKGTYEENLTIGPDVNGGTSYFYEGASAPASAGLTIQGDDRLPLANHIYLDDAFNIGEEITPVDSLGAPFGRVSLTSIDGNTIGVSVDGGDPDFVAAGLVVGDRVLIVDNDQNNHIRNVTSVLGNEIGFDGDEVAVGDRCSSIMALACVTVLNQNREKATIATTGVAVKLRGINFQADIANPVADTTQTNGLFLDSSSISINGCSFLDLTNATLANVWCVNSNINLFEFVSEGQFEFAGFRFGSLVTVGSSIGVVLFNHATLGEGTLTIQNTTPAIGRGLILDFGGSCTAKSVNIANCPNTGITVTRGANVGSTQVLGVYQCTSGIFAQGGANISNQFATLELVDNTIGLFMRRGTTTKVGSATLVSSGVRIEGNLIGLFLQSSAQFSTMGDITFTGNTNDFLIYGDSNLDLSYSTFAPSNILNHTASGTFNHAFEFQTIDGDDIDLSFDPGAAPFSPISLYVGKFFCLTNLGGTGNTLSLSAGGFFGCGFDGESVASFDAVEGATLTFWVQSATRVIVKGTCDVDPAVVARSVSAVRSFVVEDDENTKRLEEALRMLDN